jgi:hypothetical protein
MKKNIKNIIICSAVIIVGIILIFYFTKEKNISKNNDILPIKQNFITEPESAILKTQPTQEFRREDTVIFKIQDKGFSTQIRNGDTVYDAMKNLQDNELNNFSFNYKEYKGMGIFIEEINGIRGDNKYWIYSVNGIEASVGVSRFRLKSGDIISWELK